MKKQHSQLPEVRSRPPMPPVAAPKGKSNVDDDEVREIFAGIAMHGILSNPNLGHMQADKVAEIAVEAAEALLARLRGESQAVGQGA